MPVVPEVFPPVDDQVALAVERRLVEVAQRFDEALRDRVTLLLLAAAEAIVKLGEVDFAALVEHLQAWGAHWNFHQAEGNAWFFGRPLRVHLPDPPRRSVVPAILAALLTIAALGAVGWVLWEYDLVRPGERTPAATAARIVACASCGGSGRFAPRST